MQIMLSVKDREIIMHYEKVSNLLHAWLWSHVDELCLKVFIHYFMDNNQLYLFQSAILIKSY